MPPRPNFATTAFAERFAQNGMCLFGTRIPHKTSENPTIPSELQVAGQNWSGMIIILAKIYSLHSKF